MKSYKWAYIERFCGPIRLFIYVSTIFGRTKYIANKDTDLNIQVFVCIMLNKPEESRMDK